MMLLEKRPHSNGAYQVKLFRSPKSMCPRMYILKAQGQYWYLWLKVVQVNSSLLIWCIPSWNGPLPRAPISLQLDCSSHPIEMQNHN